MLNTAIILAGGFGTRLQQVVTDVPKPMAPINGIPFLCYQLRYLQKQGIEAVILSTGYLAKVIQTYFKNEWQGLQIQYAEEKTPLGTGGAIRYAMELTNSEHVLVLNGDSFFDVSLSAFTKTHIEKKADVSLALRRVEDAARYGLIEMDSQQRITAFREKSGEAGAGIINGGVYCVNRTVYLQHTPPQLNFSIETEFFKTHLYNLTLLGQVFNGYFIDIGIPSDYQKAQYDFERFAY